MCGRCFSGYDLHVWTLLSLLCSGHCSNLLVAAVHDVSLTILSICSKSDRSRLILFSLCIEYTEVVRTMVGRMQLNEIRTANSNLIPIGKTMPENDQEEYEPDAEDEEGDNAEEESEEAGGRGADPAR